MTTPALHRRLARLACPLLAAALLGACGGGDDNATPQSQLEHAQHGDEEHELPLPEGVTELDDTAASRIATAAMEAYLLQRSDETARARAARLRPLFAPGSTVPSAPPAFGSAGFPPTATYATQGDVAYMTPLRGGTADELRYLASVDVRVAVAADDQVARRRRSGTYELSVRKVGTEWRVASLRGSVEGAVPGEEVTNLDAAPRPGQPPEPADTSPLPPATPSMVDVSTAFIAERENTVSFEHPSASRWVERVRPLMTAAGWKSLNARRIDREGLTRSIAVREKWATRVKDVSCFHSAAGGRPTATRAVVFCRGEATTIDRGGLPVPPEQLPDSWPHTGPVTAALELRRAKPSDPWLVHKDVTSQF